MRAWCVHGACVHSLSAVIAYTLSLLCVHTLSLCYARMQAHDKGGRAWVPMRHTALYCNMHALCLHYACAMHALYCAVHAICMRYTAICMHYTAPYCTTLHYACAVRALCLHGACMGHAFATCAARRARTASRAMLSLSPSLPLVRGRRMWMSCGTADAAIRAVASETGLAASTCAHT
jgi:hypothetical protein